LAGAGSACITVAGPNPGTAVLDDDKNPPKNPIGGASRLESFSPAGGNYPPVGDGLGSGPPGKAMTPSHGDEGPGPGAFEGRPAPGPNVGGDAPVPQRRETPERTGDRSTLPIGGGRGSKIVFVDFGRNKVYALEDDGDEVMVFDDFADMVEKLRPSVVVADDYPRKLLPILANLAANGITFLKLKDPKLLGEARRRYGYRKSDENDVKLVRQIRHTDNIQTQKLNPDEITVKALTELWVQMTDVKKNSKQARTSINHPLAEEIHRANRRFIEKLAEEIHKEALKLPLYRLTEEKLGLRGPTLAYLLSHDGWAFKTLNSDKLQVRYQLVPLRRRRSKRSRLLIMLANTAVLNNHPRYRPIFEKYMVKFQGQRYAYWKAVLRVARRILRDLRLLTNGQTVWVPTG
jgi:hypothetical protein